MCTSPSRRSRRVRWSTCWPWCPRQCAQVGWFEAWLPYRYQYSRLRSPKEGGGYCASIRCTSVVPNFAKPRILIGLSRMIWQRCPDHQRSWRLEQLQRDGENGLILAMYLFDIRICQHRLVGHFCNDRKRKWCLKTASLFSFRRKLLGGPILDQKRGDSWQENKSTFSQTKIPIEVGE